MAVSCDFSEDIFRCDFRIKYSNYELFTCLTMYREFSKPWSRFREYRWRDWIEQFFSKHIETGIKDWSLISQVVEVFDVHLKINRGISLLDSYYDFIFDLLETGKCRCSSVIDLCVHRYFRDRLAVFEYDTFVRHVDFSLRRFTDNIPFRDPELEEFLPLKNYIHSFMLQDYTGMKRLFRYGFNINWQYDEAFEYLIETLDALIGFPKSTSYDGDPERNQILSALVRATEGEYSIFKRRRMMLLMMSIYAIINPEDYDDLTGENIKLVFKTVSDAFLTTDELHRFLEDVFRFDDSKDTKVMEFCKEFKDVFPRAEETLQPRRLKHLSRLKIRKCLADVKMLPFGVDDLKLPKSLEQYVLLE